MKVSEYMVQKLIEYGVTDAFGIPGGVILKFVAALEKTSGIEAHLNYHEQMAGFAACGYAQASGRLGLAYATRGPGITNMVTSIAEAYQESLPVLFVTAHGNRPDSGMRFENNQELDIVGIVSKITKYSANIEIVEDVKPVFEKACRLAVSGRKGPVLIDVKSTLWDAEVTEIKENRFTPEMEDETVEACQFIFEQMTKAKRPVVLIGDGIRHTASNETIYKVAQNINIPILSSRGAQDIVSGLQNYYGYIGSHGIRYSNFILSKADLIITLGNRLAFPVKSESFAPIFSNAKLIRLDVDDREFNRKISGEVSYKVDSSKFVKYLSENDYKLTGYSDWLTICSKIRTELETQDTNNVVKILSEYINAIDSKVFVCDVGNNEFWMSRAFELSKVKGTVLCSKSFGTLGVAIGKAIGAYYAIGKPITCIIGDQGFQYNLQELQFLVKWQLPINVIVLNNSASGMIADHEKKILGGKYIHVFEDCGYQAPNAKAIAASYGIDYTNQLLRAIGHKNTPLIYEIKMDSYIELVPNLPKGNACQDMYPLLNRDKYEALNCL